MCVCANLTSLAYIYSINYRMEIHFFVFKQQLFSYNLTTLFLYMHALNFSSISVDCTNIIPSIYIYLDLNRFYSEKHIQFVVAWGCFRSSTYKQENKLKNIFILKQTNLIIGLKIFSGQNFLTLICCTKHCFFRQNIDRPTVRQIFNI